MVIDFLIFISDHRTWFFYGLVIIIIYLFRKHFEIQKIKGIPISGMMRTSRGLKFMDRVSARHGKFVRGLAYTGIPVAFLGMFAILFLIFKTGIPSLLNTGPAVISPVLPGVEIPGSGIFIPLIAGWFALFIVVTIHEFGHGVVARAHKLPVLSSGLAFFGPLLAAFVEPDEKKLKKAKPAVQQSVFAAGPWFNIITGVIMTVLLMFVFLPLSYYMFSVDGIGVTKLNPETNPLITESDLAVGDIITSIDSVQIIDFDDLSDELGNKSPGDTIIIDTQNGVKNVTLWANKLNASYPVIGINLKANLKERYTQFWMTPINVLAKFLLGTPSRALGLNNDQFTWREYLFIALSPLREAGVFVLITVFSIGLGTANLIPVAILDGGRMAEIGLGSLFRKRNAKKIMRLINIVLGIFLLLLVFVPIIRSL